MARIVFNLTLNSLSNEKETVLSLTEPVSLIAFLESRQFPIGQVGLVVKNGRWEPVKDCIVYPGDQIELFPFLQGG